MRRDQATNQQRPTPAIDPSIGAVDDLPARIHAATRSPHANLNRLITARLPLCLPPHASTPQLYAFGISRFAEIYFAFEQAWVSQVSRGIHQHRSSAESLQEDEYDILDSFVNDGGGRITNILRQIYDPALLRSDRLLSDLLALNPAEDAAKSSQHLPRKNKRGKEESIHDRGRSHHKHRENAATAFATHIRSATKQNPHLLLAYTWIMYMALFNGGRWIHNKLIEGGADFWDPITSSSSDSEDLGGDPDSISDRDPTFKNTHLSFWSFPKQSDSDPNNHSSNTSAITDNSSALKSSFRNRFLAAEMLLTELERNQIIDETIEIFRRCAEIVNEIDLEVARGAYRESRYPSSSSSSSSDSHGSSTITGIPSITIQPPSSSSLSHASSSQGSVITTRQPEPGRPPRRFYVNPFFAGAAGLLGGLCAWFWNVNSEAVQWGYRALIGG